MSKVMLLIFKDVLKEVTMTQIAWIIYRISYTLSYVRVALATLDVQSILDIPATDEILSEVHSAFHPFVVGKMSTSITGDKLCMQRERSAPPAVSCG